jgi:hypothetical protein
VLSYTSDLLEKVAAQTAASQRINKYQRLFKLEETKSVFQRSDWMMYQDRVVVQALHSMRASVYSLPHV